MTTSTDAILFFGWLVDEESELPWRAEGEEGDAKEWYRSVMGYTPPFELFTAEGELIDAATPQERLSAYFDAQSAWDDAHPLPFEEVLHCSDGEAMYAVAVLGTCISASRGYPQEIALAALTASPDGIDAARKFCKKHGVPISGKPKWWLVSWWG